MPQCVLSWTPLWSFLSRLHLIYLFFLLTSFICFLFIRSCGFVTILLFSYCIITISTIATTSIIKDTTTITTVNNTTTTITTTLPTTIIDILREEAHINSSALWPLFFFLLHFPSFLFLLFPSSQIFFLHIFSLHPPPPLPFFLIPFSSTFIPCPPPPCCYSCCTSPPFPAALYTSSISPSDLIALLKVVPDGKHLSEMLKLDTFLSTGSEPGRSSNYSGTSACRKSIG